MIQIKCDYGGNYVTITKRICPCNFADINKPLRCRHFKIDSRRKRLFYCGVRRPLHGRTLPAIWKHDVSGQQVVNNSSGLVSNTYHRVYVRKRGEENMPASRRIQLPTSCLFWSVSQTPKIPKPRGGCNT